MKNKDQSRILKISDWYRPLGLIVGMLVVFCLSMGTVGARVSAAGLATPSPTVTQTSTPKPTKTPTLGVTYTSTLTLTPGALSTGTATLALTPGALSSVTPTLPFLGTRPPTATETLTPLPTYLPTLTSTSSRTPTPSQTLTVTPTGGPLLDSTRLPGAPSGEAREAADITLRRIIVRIVAVVAVGGGLLIAGMYFVIIRRSVR